MVELLEVGEVPGEEVASTALLLSPAVGSAKGKGIDLVTAVAIIRAVSGEGNSSRALFIGSKLCLEVRHDAVARRMAHVVTLADHREGMAIIRINF